MWFSWKWWNDFAATTIHWKNIILIMNPLASSLVHIFTSFLFPYWPAFLPFNARLCCFSFVSLYGFIHATTQNRIEFSRLKSPNFGNQKNKSKCTWKQMPEPYEIYSFYWKWAGCNGCLISSRYMNNFRLCYKRQLIRIKFEWMETQFLFEWRQELQLSFCFHFPMRILFFPLNFWN